MTLLDPRYHDIPIESCSYSVMFSLPYFLGFRAFVALWAVATFIYSVIAYGDWTYIVWFTYWNEMIFTCSSVLACIATYCEWKSLPPHDSKGHKLAHSQLHRVTFVLCEMSMLFGLIVVTLYWSERTDDKSFDNLRVHGLTTAVVFIDFVSSYILFVPGHIIFPAFIISAYLVVNCIYTLNFKPVYKRLDFKTSNTFLVLLAGLIAFHVYYFTLCFISRHKTDFCGLDNYLLCNKSGAKDESECDEVCQSVDDAVLQTTTIELEQEAGEQEKDQQPLSLENSLSEGPFTK